MVLNIICLFCWESANGWGQVKGPDKVLFRSASVSLEAPHQCISDEYPEHIFFMEKWQNVQVDMTILFGSMGQVQQLYRLQSPFVQNLTMLLANVTLKFLSWSMANTLIFFAEKILFLQQKYQCTMYLKIP